MKKTVTREYLIDTKGHRRAVVLPLPEYEQLLENYHDLQIIAARKENIKIPAGHFVARLRKSAYRGY